jgi:hypothetical protein
LKVARIFGGKGFFLVFYRSKFGSFPGFLFAGYMAKDVGEVGTTAQGFSMFDAF